MRRVFLLALLPLVACASPQERCIANAGKDIRVMTRLINTTQANINRGYAIRTEEYFRNEEQVCGELAGEPVYCDVPVAYSRDVPVAIDLNAEADKLDSLLAKRAELTVRADAVIAECRLLHPEV